MIFKGVAPLLPDRSSGRLAYKSMQVEIRTAAVARLRGAPFVTVMQTADFSNCDDVAVGRRLDGSGGRRVLVEREVRSGLE